MRAITLVGGPYTAGSATAIAASQSPGSGAILINGSLASGGVATLDNARRVTIASGGNDSGITFTITGTSVSGNTLSETITGGNVATVVSKLDYLTVTSVTHTGSVASTVTVGTSVSGTNTPVASSAWARLDDYGFSPLFLNVEVTGTVNYTVEASDDDCNITYPPPATAPGAMVWFAPDTNLSAKTGSASDTLAAKPKWLRLTINSATAGAGNSAEFDINPPGGKGG